MASLSLLFSCAPGTNGRLKVSGRAGVVSAIESGESSAKLSGGLGWPDIKQ